MATGAKCKSLHAERPAVCPVGDVIICPACDVGEAAGRRDEWACWNCDAVVTAPASWSKAA